MEKLKELKEEILGAEAANPPVAPSLDERVLDALHESPGVRWAREHAGEASPELRGVLAGLFKAAGFKGGDGALEKAKDAFLGIFPAEANAFDMAMPRSATNGELHRAGVPEDAFDDGTTYDQPLLQAQADSFAADLPGGLRSSIATACYLLRTFPAIVGGKLEFNEMTGLMTIDRKEVRDEDVTRARERVEIQFNDRKGQAIQIGKDMFWDALLLVAKEHTYHPVREYLRGVIWDGEKRLERVVAEVLRAEGTTINRLMVRKFAIGCVARAMKPGAKVDNMLVIVGGQGLQKSFFFKELAGEEYFTDAYIDFENPKDLMVMRTAWIAEFAEMKSLLAAQSEESVKAGLTRTEDRYVPPYGRASVVVKRHTVFGGTANPKDLFRDPTGNRRYWPITTEGEIDLETLRAWRDQLWAEAVVAYDTGEKWWFIDAQEKAELEDVVAGYMKSDAWDGAVLKWADERFRDVDYQRKRLAAQGKGPDELPWGEFELSDVLSGVLGIQVEKQDPKASGRVKTILEANGYPSVRPNTPKGVRKPTFYIRKDLAEGFKAAYARIARERLKGEQTERERAEKAREEQEKKYAQAEQKRKERAGRLPADDLAQDDEAVAP